MNERTAKIKTFFHSEKKEEAEEEEEKGVNRETMQSSTRRQGNQGNQRRSGQRRYATSEPMGALTRSRGRGLGERTPALKNVHLPPKLP